MSYCGLIGPNINFKQKNTLKMINTGCEGNEGVQLFPTTVTCFRC